MNVFDAIDAALAPEPDHETLTADSSSNTTTSHRNNNTSKKHNASSSIIHSIGSGDARQVALFSYLWKEEHERSQQQQQRELDDGTKVNDEQSNISVIGNVGWAGVANILTAALVRNRRVYKDPCQCEHCLLFTAANAKGPTHNAPIIDTNPIGKIGSNVLPPLSGGGGDPQHQQPAGGDGNVTTSTSASTAPSPPPTTIIDRPAFSHTSVFNDLGPERRLLLADGKGMPALMACTEALQTEMRRAAEECFPTTAAGGDSSAQANPNNNTLGSESGGIRSSTMALFMNDPTTSHVGNGTTASVGISSRFASSAFSARGQVGFSTAMQRRDRSQQQQQQSAGAKRAKLGYGEHNNEEGVGGGGSDDEVHDFTAMLPPPNSLPFVSEFLQHNRPLGLLSLAPAGHRRLKSDAVGCVAKHIGWHQQIVGAAQGLQRFPSCPIASPSSPSPKESAVYSGPASCLSEVAQRLQFGGVSEATEWVLKDLSDDRGDKCNSSSRLLVRSYQMPPNASGTARSIAGCGQVEAAAEPLLQHLLDQLFDGPSACDEEPNSTISAKVRSNPDVAQSRRLLLCRRYTSEVAHRYATGQPLTSISTGSAFSQQQQDEVSTGGGGGDNSHNQHNRHRRDVFPVGLDLLLHPMANSYRPRSVALWDTVGETLCYGEAPQFVGEGMASSAITRHVLLSAAATDDTYNDERNGADHRGSFSSSSPPSIPPIAPSRLTELCVGRCRIAQSLLIALASAAPLLTVLVIDNVSGWEMLGPSGAFYLGRGDSSSSSSPSGTEWKLSRVVSRPRKLSSFSSSSDDDSEGGQPSSNSSSDETDDMDDCDGMSAPADGVRIPSSPWLLMAALLAEGPSRPRLETLIISNIPTAVSGGGAAFSSFSSTNNSNASLVVDPQLAPFSVVFAQAVAKSRHLTHLALDGLNLRDGPLEGFWDTAMHTTMRARTSSTTTATGSVPVSTTAAPASASVQRGFASLKHLCLNNNRLTPKVLGKMASITMSGAMQKGHHPIRTIESLDLSRNNFSTADGTQVANAIQTILSAPSSAVSVGPQSSSKDDKRGGIGLSIKHTQLPSAEVGKFFRTFRRLANEADPNANINTCRGGGSFLSHLSLGGRSVDVSDLKLLPDCFLQSQLCASPQMLGNMGLTSLDLSFTDLSISVGGQSSSSAVGPSASSVAAASSSTAFPTTHPFFNLVLPQLLPQLERLNLSHCELNEDACQRLCASVEKAMAAMGLATMATTAVANRDQENAAEDPSEEDSRKKSKQSAWVLQQQQKKLQKKAAGATKGGSKKTKEEPPASTPELPTLDDASGGGTTSSSGLPLTTLLLDGNGIGVEGLRYIVKATRAQNCPQLTTLGLSFIETDAASTLSDHQQHTMLMMGHRAAAGYTFKDSSAQMRSQWAAVLRHLVAQINHSHLTVLDLSGNASFLSHMPLVEEMMRHVNNAKVKLWEDDVGRCKALNVSAVAAAASASSAAATEAKLSVATDAPPTPLFAVPRHPPIGTLVLRNIDMNWEANLTHDGRYALPFAQCIFC